jgi:hypothetical protein
MSEKRRRQRNSAIRPFLLSGWSGEYEIVDRRAVITLTEQPDGGEKATTLRLTLDQIDALTELLSLAAVDLRVAEARALTERLAISTPWDR